MAITLTEAAARRVSDHLESRGHGEGLRLGVKTTGCSGLAYVVDFADEIGTEEDIQDSAFGLDIGLTDKVVPALGGILQTIQLIEVH